MPKSTGRKKKTKKTTEVAAAGTSVGVRDDVFTEADFARVPLVPRFDYLPTWPSLDSRPLPPWYNDAKFGIFIHWGVYSVPAFAQAEEGESACAEWYFRKLQMPRKDHGATRRHHTEVYGGAPYSDFAGKFTASQFDPRRWADLFRRAGARYCIMTTKHHDGFCLFPSADHPRWNSVDVGPHRDLVGEFAEAVRAEGMAVGTYYSLLEWGQSATKVESKYDPEVVARDVRRLVEGYRSDVIWFDGHWGKSAEFWKTRELLAWLYNSSAVRERVVVNDRLGAECPGKHGDFTNMKDRFVAPGTMRKKWECCMTIGTSWGHNKELKPSAYKSAAQILRMLCEIVARNGNLLLNVGPTAEGTITAEETATLEGIGAWLGVNGRAIFGSRPWFKAPPPSLSPEVVFTMGEDGTTVWAIALSIAEGNKIPLPGLVEPPKSAVAITGVETEMENLAGVAIVKLKAPPPALPFVMSLTF